MAYKMICLDLDGTLLNKQNELNQEDIDILRKCLEKGIYVYIVSGRPYFFARYIANQISPKVAVISSNGGCYEFGDKLIERPIDKKVLNQLIDILASDNMHAFYKNKEEIYTMDEPDLRFIYDQYNAIDGFPHTVSYNNLSLEELKEKAQKVDKVLVYNMNKETLISSRQKAIEIDGLVISSYNDISYDVNSKDTTKGFVIKLIADKLKIDRESILAYGDNENDIPMFEACGYTVAMKNGNERIKAMADEVTDDYLHAGVAKSLKKIFEF